MNIVEQFLQTYPVYRKDIEKILQYEKENKEKWEQQRQKAIEENRKDMTGWEWGDVRVEPTHLKTMLINDILIQVYSSHSATVYRLVDSAIVETALTAQLETNGKSEDILADVTISDMETIEFSAIKDPIEHFAPMICPELSGHDDVKKAILLMLVNDKDTANWRDRLHILLGGIPGTGKSVLIDWIVLNFHANYVDPNTSRVGLVGDASGGSLTPGMLNRSHMGILCVDELEMMKDKDALREAMERGKYKIVKGSHDEFFNAEVRIIGGLNEVSKLSAPLRERFDFEFEFTTPTVNESKSISQKVLSLCFDNIGSNATTVKKYLKWINGFKPKLSAENRKIAEEIFNKYFEYKEIGKSGRWIASCIRIAKAIAKLSKRDVEPHDFVAALSLKDPALNGMMALKDY